MDKTLDLTGQRFGKLTAIRFTGESYPGRGRIWLCKCDCGNYIEAPVGRLNAGGIKACKDCTKINHIQGVKIAQSLRREKLYGVWSVMKQRCKNKNNNHFRFYGQRGIKVCDEWANSYSTFREWAFSSGYKEGLSIERIDVNGDYCPSNCKWIELQEQAYNKTNTCYIIYKNKKVPLSKMIHDLGLDYNIIRNYVRRYKE